MRQQHLFAIAACLCSAAVVLVSAVPLPAGNQELDVLQIPLSDGKEIDVLTLGAKDQEQIIAERNKRTIGLLRELFPDITKQIDDIVNRIIGQVIRVAGPSLLPALLGNNRPTTERSDFDADFEDDDDTSNDVNAPSNSASTTAANNENGGTRVSIVLPTFPPEAGSTTPAPTAAADNVSLAQATTGVAASTATTTAAAIATTTTTPNTTTTTVATITSTQPTTELTTTTSRPVEIPTTLPSTTTTTTTTSATSPITIPTPTPTILSPTTLPTTTVNSILVIPRTKSKSNAIPTDINGSTVNSVTESTESTFDTATTPIPPALPETAPPSQYPTDSTSISDILNTPTKTNTIGGEPLPTPTIPATYIGRFEGDVASPAKSQQQPSSSPSNALPLAVDVDRSQLVALVDNINRLLNSPNLLITNSNNPNTQQFMTTTTTTNPITRTPLTAVSTQSSAFNATAKITKLLPVSN
ncbi:uncharacterized protein LOC105213921 isoform X1 [Zeugodacus cucurbitae]|uniref:uncharacterized protein LOC105213921 isoform X1 n=1 Tax=Zeugodacus cucurbitae TaxID=28588 RepID=UPI0023D92A09|nr:uncharacterized protein LOC105213921 isoform X1 [Zeugodacus cucurbitae]XP_054087848.1 uncharacterized protein LOC105213921 isoform X1 [Zeugodacus cucurbitae]